MHWLDLISQEDAPKGRRYHWVRYTVYGEAIPGDDSLEKATKSGWTFVPFERHKEKLLESGHFEKDLIIKKSGLILIEKEALYVFKSKFYESIYNWLKNLAIKLQIIKREEIPA